MAVASILLLQVHFLNSKEINLFSFATLSILVLFFQTKNYSQIFKEMVVSKKQKICKLGNET